MLSILVASAIICPPGQVPGIDQKGNYVCTVVDPGRGKCPPGWVYTQAIGSGHQFVCVKPDKKK